MPFDKDALSVDKIDQILTYDPESGKLWWKIKHASKVIVGHEAGSAKVTRPGGPLYRYVRVLGKSMPAARVAWALHYGEWPIGKIYFENGDPTNLRISNLRMGNSLQTKFDRDSATGPSEYLREHREKFPMEWKDSHLRGAFGITLAEYGDMLLAQGGVCATCKKPETQTRHGKVKALSVDHDHVTGKVRGLLCGHCNTALGKVGDNRDVLLAMISYLDQHAAHAVAPLEVESLEPTVDPENSEGIH